MTKSKKILFMLAFFLFMFTFGINIMSSKITNKYILSNEKNITTPQFARMNIDDVKPILKQLSINFTIED